MEQRKPTTVDPTQVNITQGDLLTGDSIPNHGQRPNVMRPPQGAPIPQMQNQIPNQNQTLPDLHQEGLSSTPQTRQDAVSRVDQIYNDIETEVVQKKIDDDIDSARQPGFMAAPNSPRDILKQLISKGDYSETVKLYGYNWTIRALDQRDLILASEMIRDDVTTRTAQISAIMFAQVIFSIEAVNGISIYEWFPDIKPGSYKDRESYNLAVKRALGKYLEHVGPQVIDDFYQEYKKIEDKRNKGLEQLKNS